MNINEIIKTRRATPPRFLAKKEISKDRILQLLESANWAPNHKQTEPWRFKVYTGDAKQKLADEIHFFLIKKIESGESVNLQKVEQFRNSLIRVPVAIAIILERDIANRIPEWEEIAAVSMAVQNMWLTATEINLGAFWSTPQFLPILNGNLNLGSRQKLLGFLFVGEIAMDYPSQGRGNINEKVEWK